MVYIVHEDIYPDKRNPFQILCQSERRNVAAEQIAEPVRPGPKAKQARRCR
jgi:hypothetical protein